MKNFLLSGATMTVVAAVDVLSGNPVLVGDIVGIAGHDAVTGQEVVVHFVGVYENLPKVSAQAWTVGVSIYWDAVAAKLTTAAAAGANKLVGHAAAVADNPSATGSVRLSS
ncbi:DUF2190 family protein [Devosia sp. XGJD_8]|uniref:DUF2190 family protein n=1 Tax=Devosia sp. XGJD_8 TaxID=3391187 RepID=UPI0039852DD3